MPDEEIRALVALVEARQAISDRAQDLRWCNKDDDCHTKADGADLALDDFDTVLAKHDIFIEGLSKP